MNPTAPRLVEAAPLPYLLASPDAAPSDGPRPVLCFLHGYDEGPPAEIRAALIRHGPLRSEGLPPQAEDLLRVAPQLPARGDLWHRHADGVAAVVKQVWERHGGDPQRTYLTGFSYGGNGVFDLALAQPGLWAALWAVDPTRVPAADPRLPVWLSFGEVARYGKRGFLERLALAPADGEPAGDRLYTDRGEDHEGSANSAYGEERVYRWLLARRRPDSGG